MSILFIVNRTAGNGRAGREWDKFYPKIKGTFPDFRVVFTESQGHATFIARDSDEDLIVSCGGDGTLNEVANGLAGKKAKLGIIPLGTGSDFGKTIGVRDVDKAIATIIEGKSKRFDVGKVNFESLGTSRFFVNILEIGFGAEVMSYVNRHKAFGRLSFLMGVISVIGKLKRFSTEFSYDGKETAETIEVIVANGRYFGGGMLASPSSSIDDGFLDLHILKPVSRISTLINLNKLVSGRYISLGLSIEAKSPRFRFSDMGNLVEIDGEVVGRTPISVEILPGYLEILVPSQ
ncbi:MAG: diacylglycerol/lipid kinase family protein [Thermoplasmata archaeon]